MVMGSPVSRRVSSSAPGLYSLEVSINLSPQCDIIKCLQKLCSGFWGQNPTAGENHCSSGMQSFQKAIHTQIMEPIFKKDHPPEL